MHICFYKNPINCLAFSSWITSSARLGSEGQLSEFIEGLGPGQLVGRQVLASPALGDIQLSICDRKGNLEVEVIRARGLQCKPGSKTLPGKIFLRLSPHNPHTRYISCDS